MVKAAVTDLAGLAEVEAGACDRRDLAGGDQVVIYGQHVIGVYAQAMATDIAPSVEVEEAVMGQTAWRGGVRLRGQRKAQGTVRQCDRGADRHIAGKTHMSIGQVQLQPDTGGGECRNPPQMQVRPDASAMQRMTAAKIRVGVMHPPVQREARAPDPVGEAPDDGPEIARRSQIGGGVGRAQNQRMRDAVQPQILHDGTQVQHLRRQAATLQGDALHLPAIGQGAEGGDAHKITCGSGRPGMSARIR